MTISSPPRSFQAGEREAIVRCPPCGQPIVLGELVAACPACGTIHHTGCWTQNGGCGTYACAPARRENIAAASGASGSAPAGAGVMRVTSDDIARAPIPATAPLPAAQHGAALSRTAWAAETDAPSKFNRACVAGFVLAFISIPAFGLATGWIAVLVGVIGLVLRKPRERGLGFGVAGVLIGTASALVWSALYIPKWSGPEGVQLFTSERQDIDPESLADLPATIGRPMRSNVLISSGSGFTGMTSMGSGVVLKLAAGSALILTNRHVVDSSFEGRGGANDALPGGNCEIKFLGKSRVGGRVVWIAPQGVDAALVEASLDDAKHVDAACWDEKPHCKIAEKVFVVGNPMGLGWSHASGEISQIRRESFGTLDVRIIQISAPVNHGHSGGGLYDEQGKLLGINTWTQDKRSAEGLSFSIAFHSILELIPKSFEIPASRSPPAAASTPPNTPPTLETTPPKTAGSRKPSDPS